MHFIHRIFDFKNSMNKRKNSINEKNNTMIEKITVLFLITEINLS